MLSTALHPDRSLVVPMLVVLAPLLWFGYRGATAPSTATLSFDPTPAAVAAVVAGSLAVSYLLAAAVDAALGLRTVDPAGRPVVAALARPSDAALAVVAAVGVGVGAYLLGSALVGLPGWVDAVVAPVGVVIALPLLVADAGVLAVGNAVAVESFAAEAVAVAVGVSLSVVWVFLLAGGAVAVVGPLAGGATPR